jgi:hypothetical protein
MMIIFGAVFVSVVIIWFGNIVIEICVVMIISMVIIYAIVIMIINFIIIVEVTIYEIMRLDS